MLKPCVGAAGLDMGRYAAHGKLRHCHTPVTHIAAPPDELFTCVPSRTCMTSSSTPVVPTGPWGWPSCTKYHGPSMLHGM